jgi:hypothetical protein
MAVPRTALCNFTKPAILAHLLFQILSQLSDGFILWPLASPVPNSGECDVVNASSALHFL